MVTAWPRCARSHVMAGILAPPVLALHSCLHAGKDNRSRVQAVCRASRIKRSPMCRISVS